MMTSRRTAHSRRYTVIVGSATYHVTRAQVLAARTRLVTDKKLGRYVWHAEIKPSKTVPGYEFVNALAHDAWGYGHQIRQARHDLPVRRRPRRDLV